MRKCLAVLFLFVLSSCQLFMSREEKTDKLVHDKLQEIDWNEVDQYPLFDNCDEMAPKATQRECFRTEMTRLVSEALESLQWEVKNDLNDTVLIDFKVDEDGFISITEMEVSPSILAEIQDFNEQIRNQLKDLTVAPAVKRAKKVSMRFRLPVVLNTQP
ncbi:hypothetical protein [Flagellimonas sp.]|uniref:hypothetical protein n=1 Tax=Flagellimonas sp. TaxID=2058762 RepID=UPI003BB1B83E